MKKLLGFVIIMFLCTAVGQTSPASAQMKSYGDIDVILYVTNWCPHCRTAKAYLTDLGVSLVVYDIDADKSKKEEMLQKSGGSKGVPFIDVEGIMIRGFNPTAIKNAVEKKRNSQ